MGIEIQYLFWDAFKFTSAEGVRVVVDPNLDECPEEGLPAGPIPSRDLGEVDIVLVTHAAADHLGQAFEIMDRTRAVLVCGHDVRTRALAHGIPRTRIATVVPGSIYDRGDVRVKAFATVHISFSRTEDGQYLTGVPFGYLLRFGTGEVLYHAGDTSLTSDLKLIGEVYRPHLAMLGVAGVIHNGRAILEMDPYEAAIAARMLGVHTAIPMHYFPDREDGAEFCRQVAEHALGVKPVLLRPGDRALMDGPTLSVMSP